MKNGYGAWSPACIARAILCLAEILCMRCGRPHGLPRCRRSAVSDHRIYQSNVVRHSVLSEDFRQLTNPQYTHMRACVMFLPRRIGLCARFSNDCDAINVRKIAVAVGYRCRAYEVRAALHAVHQAHFLRTTRSTRTHAAMRAHRNGRHRMSAALPPLIR
jgi:hypothetical protein